MAQNPTLEDVARAAGVSRATASRAIRGAGKVSAIALEAVDRAVKDLGYVPNSAARSLVTRETGAVALVVAEPDERIFSDPFFGAAIAGVVEALVPTDKQLILAMRTRNGGDERLTRYLGNQQVDGVVVISHHDNDQFLAVLRERAVPTVLVGRPACPESDDFGMPYVDLDNRLGGKLAAEHLIAQGCTRLATITGPLDMPAAQDRLHGWREGLEAAGIEEFAMCEGDFTPRTGRLGAQELLATGERIDGVFAASDMMALTALQEFEEHGLRVPDDIRVVGFDDSAMAEDSHPPLTTITNPARAMTTEATRLLLSLIRGEEVEGPVVLTPRVLARESSGGGSTLKDPP